MPKSLLSDIKQGSVEIAGEEVDLTELQSAYERDLDQKALSMAGNAQGTPDMGGGAPDMSGAAPAPGGAPNAAPPA